MEQQQRPAYIKAMLRDIEEQRKRLMQPALFEELQSEREQQLSLQELEWELHAKDYIERMKQMVMAEQQRIIEKVLPKRYALATVDLQPLAIEYVIRSTGNPGKERL